MEEAVGMLRQQQQLQSLSLQLINVHLLFDDDCSGVYSGVK